MLLSCSELKAKLGQPVVVDGSWHMPASGRDPLKEFKDDGHIPGGACVSPTHAGYHGVLVS